MTGPLRENIIGTSYCYVYSPIVAYVTNYGSGISDKNVIDGWSIYDFYPAVAYC